MNQNKMRLYKGMWVSSMPHHLGTRLSREEVRKILHGGGYGLRNTYDFDTAEPTGFWFVIKDSFGGMEECPSKVRNQVRRALKTYDYKRVSGEEILRIGLPIFQAAQAHYRVKTKPVTKEVFERSIQNGVKAGNYEFWCAYEKESGTPVAISINILEEDCCNYSTLKFDPEYLNSTYPSYGLFYEMNRYYLDERKLKYVNDGARSITEHSNIQPFLISKFNFRKAYCRLQIEYKWWMRWAVDLLYPFREWIPVAKVKAVLRMEAMKRGAR